MKRFAKLLLVTVGFGALGFVMSLVPQKNATGAGGAPVTIMNTASNAVPVTGNVTMPTHLGVNPSQFVNLFARNLTFGGGTPWTQVGPDGSTQSFSIPSGQVLIITDIEFSVNGNAGSTAFFTLGVGGADLLWMSPGIPIVNPIAAEGVDHLTSGFVVTQLPFWADALAINSINSINLQGYLAPQQ